MSLSKKRIAMEIFELLLRIFQGAVSLIGIFSNEKRRLIIRRWRTLPLLIVIEEVLGAVIGLIIIMTIVYFIIR